MTKSSHLEYSPIEEKWNVFTHAFGLILAVLGTVLLGIKSSSSSTLTIFSVLVFGLSMIALYAASTFYHKSTSHKVRSRFQILDHASIYVLIAGSYTPFALVTLKGTAGWILFTLVWVFGLTGMVLKIFYTGRYNKLSTLMYVVMGWSAIFVILPLIENLTWNGFYWLLTGGISYTIGAGFFLFDALRFNHAIFHVFVLAGTICHFLAVYWYVV